MNSIRFTAPKPLPDFRQVIAFLWCDGHNVDSDGNSHNPAQRDWTYLYLSNRESEEEMLEVFDAQEEPHVMEVESESLPLAARTAYFLASTAGGDVSLDSGPFTSPTVLLPLVGEDFDSVAALRRAADSPFARSTLDNPFPNLSREDAERATRAFNL